VAVCVAAGGEKAASDRQLQEQRKRKAAAFLTRMKQSDVSQVAEDTAAECASNSGSLVCIV